MQEWVEKKLQELEQVENCRVLLAVESGSRAWGFPSADSDFDVRFIYLRPREWYLSIDEGRDVIERPLDERDVDLSGWDLKKALKLLRKSNPPLLEWLQSPLIYKETTSVPAGLRALIPEAYSPQACLHHYLHMAQANFREYLRGETVRVKKYFYVLRPVFACLWIEAGLGVVPMEFSRLLEAVLPEGEVRREVERLLEEKKSGVELGTGPARPVLNLYLDQELERIQKSHPKYPSVPDPTESFNEFFRKALDEVWGDPRRI